MLDSPQLEAAIWSIADGRGSDDDLALFHADERASLRDARPPDRRRRGRPRLGAHAARRRARPGRRRPHRDAREPPRAPPPDCARRRPTPPTPDRDESDDDGPTDGALEPGRGPAAGVVVDRTGRRLGGGRGATPESNDELSAGWRRSAGRRWAGRLHPGVAAARWVTRRRAGDPDEGRARLARRRRRRPRPDGVGASVLWLGQVALEGVRLAAAGSIVPTLRVPQTRPQGRIDRRRGALAAGARRQPGDRRARGGDAGHGRRRSTAATGRRRRPP